MPYTILKPTFEHVRLRCINKQYRCFRVLISETGLSFSIDSDFTAQHTMQLYNRLKRRYFPALALSKSVRMFFPETSPLRALFAPICTESSWNDQDDRSGEEGPNVCA